jgi:hypothetical protein
MIHNALMTSSQQISQRRSEVKSRTMFVFTCCIVIALIISGAFKSVEGKAPTLIPQYFVDDLGTGVVCTQITPCNLTTALSKADTEMNIYLAAGIYTGTGDEVVYIDSYKVINLYGGWNGTTVFPPVRDPDIYASVIDGQGQRRGIKVEFKVGPDELSPVITGLSITGGNGSVLAGADCNYSGYDGCGGGIFLKYASPEISFNKIYGNFADAQNIVSKQGHGGGIFSMYSEGANIHDNLIYANTADPNHQGNGGGVELNSSSEDTEFYNNIVYENTSGIYPDYSWGAGLSLEYDYSQIHDNYFYDNGEQGTDRVLGSAIFLWYGGPVIERNRMTNNYGEEVVYLGNANNAVFNQNRIWDNHSPRVMQLTSTYRADPDTCGATEYVTVKNNFISGNGDIGIHVAGSETNPLCGRLWNNTIDGDSAGVYLIDQSTVYMVNNIISRHSGVGIDIAEGATTPTVYHTLFYQNGSNGYAGLNSVIGDPQYLDSSNGNFHIWCTSAARDSGTPLSSVTDDIDSQTRPQFSGVDIGADECTPLFYLPLIKRP